ncbi:MAG: MMPL family transporter [Thermoplasmatota archaeon]
MSRWIGSWAQWSQRNRAWVLVGLFAITGFLGAGLGRIQTEVDLLDILPEGDPNTEAARALQASFGSAYTQHVTLDLRANTGLCESESARLLPLRQTPIRCGNTTDEVYVRAMDEIQEFFLNHPDTPFEFVIGANSFYRLLNWTAAGGADAPPSAFAMPGRDLEGELRYRLLDETAYQTVPEALTTPMGHEGKSYVMILIPREGPSSQDVGRGAIDVLAEYVAAVDAGETTWRVFGTPNAPTYYTELAIADAHSAELLRQDLSVLLPLLVGFILAILYVGFRSPSAVALASGAIVVSSVWVFGAMGWLGVPLNTFNLAIAPLILGVGIDMGIHFLTAYQSFPKDPLRQAGEEAGFAMLVATATTALGLLVLALGPSPLIGQMGLVAAIAIATVFVVTMLLIPACATPSMGLRFHASKFMPWLGRAVRRHRFGWSIGVACLLGLATIGTFFVTVEPFGEFALNYEEGDPYRDRHIENLQVYYNTAPGEPIFIGNVLVVQGDMLDPAVHAYIERIAEELEQADFVNTRSMTHLPYLVEQYDAVRNGVPGAALVVGQDTLLPLVGLEREKADSREEIKEVLDEAFAGPMAHFASLFVDREYQLSLITFSTQTGDFAHVEQSWDAVWAAVERAGDGPAEVAFVGNTPTNYLFVKEELPFVTYLGIASFLGVVLLVGITTRSVRNAAIVGLVVGGSTLLFLGSLPLLGIGMSIYLVIPLVFISAIGSDYVMHAAWALRNRDLDAVYATVGKAILFGAATDAGAFVVFAFARDLAIRTTLVAATVAVGMTFFLAAVGIALMTRHEQTSAPLTPK